MLYELFFILFGFVSCIGCIIGVIVFGLGVIENKQDSERRIRSFAVDISKKQENAGLNGSPSQVCVIVSGNDQWRSKSKHG